MDVPEDVAEELHANGVLDVFDALPASHRREYVNWIAEAKKPDTRASRIVKTCEMLAEKTSR